MTTTSASTFKLEIRLDDATHPDMPGEIRRILEDVRWDLSHGPALPPAGTKISVNDYNGNNVGYWVVRRSRELWEGIK